MPVAPVVPEFSVIEKENILGLRVSEQLRKTGSAAWKSRHDRRFITGIMMGKGTLAWAVTTTAASTPGQRADAVSLESDGKKKQPMIRTYHFIPFDVFVRALWLGMGVSV